MAPLAGVFDPAEACPLMLGSRAGLGQTVHVALDGRLLDLSVPTHDGRLGRARDVVGAGWARRGEQFLRDLRGDFALALWDEQRRAGLIARDQLGGRAVFMRRSGRRLLFATELRDLIALLPARPAPDRMSLLHWVSMHDPRGPRTLYEGVDALPPGHAVRLTPDGWEVFRWWAPRYERPLRSSRAELVDRLRVGVETAVSRASDTDEAIGVLMSGGLDSTTVTAVAHGRCRPPRRPPAAYSLVYPNLPSADESDWIDLMARELDLESVRHRVKPTSLLPAALDFIRTWQLPPRPRTFGILLPLLRRASDDGVKVVMDGEGGDLVFGAPAGLLADRVQRGRLAAAVRLARRFPGAGDRPPLRPVMQLVAGYGLRGALPAGLHAWLRTRGDLTRHLPSWIGSAERRELVEQAGHWDWKRLDGPRWWACLAEAIVDGQEAIDIRGDVRRRGAMAGVESRSPLLDLDLVELVLRFPPELAFDPVLSRPLLREAMTGVLPERVRLRPDKSFLDEFTRRSLLGHDLPAIERLLGARDAELRAYIDLERARNELLETPLERASHGPRFSVTALWRLATAECWLREQAHPGQAHELLELGADPVLSA
jgi:asparagine synthase (glutamine-hydrolysing)